MTVCRGAATAMAQRGASAKRWSGSAPPIPARPA